MEIWDLYDINGNKSDIKIDRHARQTIPDGLYHMVCDILVQHEDGSFLLTKRHPEKDVYPGFWEASAGGSAVSGESPLQCAVRELKEETGIQIKADDLVLISHTHSEKSRSSFFSYFVKVNCPKDSVVLQESETVDYKWVDTEGFLEYVDSDEAIKSHNMRYEGLIERLRNQ